MAYWLLKTEPQSYSWDRLVREKKAVWDGVTNPTALKHIRSMSKGDEALIYHTGDEKACIGVAEVVSDSFPDPKSADPRTVVVEIKPKSKLQRPVSLAEIKVDSTFSGWDLLRISRLSVMPVPPVMWKRVMQLGKSAAGSR